MAGLLLFWRDDDGLRPVDVSPDATVGNLKDAIAAAGGPVAARQALVYGQDAELDDRALLSDIGVCSQAVVQLRSRVIRRRRQVIGLYPGTVLGILEDGKAYSFHDQPERVSKAVQCVEIASCSTSALALQGGQVRRLWTHRTMPRGRMFEHGDAATGLAVSQHSVYALCNGKACLGAGTISMGELPEGYIVNLSIGESHAVAVMADQTAVAISRNPFTWTEIPEDTKHKVLDAACGARHTLLLLADGSVVAFGDPQFTAVPDTGGRRVKSIACGRVHSVLVLEDGAVLAFGDRSLCQHICTDDPAVAVTVVCSSTFIALESGAVMSYGRAPATCLVSTSDVTTFASEYYDWTVCSNP